MLEKCIKSFDSCIFIEQLKKARGITKAEALSICREEIPKESYYQNKIRKAIARRYPEAYVFKVNQGPYSQTGVPDLAVVYRGHYFGFEVKRPVLGEVSKLQAAAIQAIGRAGGTAAVVRWPEECFEIIDNWEKADGVVREAIASARLLAGAQTGGEK